MAGFPQIDPELSLGKELFETDNLEYVFDSMSTILDDLKPILFAAVFAVGACTPAFSELKDTKTSALLAARCVHNGDVHMADADYQAALDDYRQYMTLVSKPEPRVISRMAVCDAWLGRKLLAQREFERVATMEGESLNGYLARFDAHLAVFEYDEALDCAQRCCQRFSSEWKGPWRLGFLHDKYGEYKEAISEYSKAIRLYRPGPDDGAEELAGESNLDRLYGLRAHCNYRLGNYQESLADCTKLIALQPKLRTAYESRAETRIRLKDLAGAESDLKQAVALHSKRPRTYKQLGYCQSARGDFKAAILSLTQAIEIFPRYADAFHLRAEAYRQLGNQTSAAADDKSARLTGFSMDGAV